MGAVRGSISCRRYAVLDALPAEVRRKFSKGIRAHAFAPLDPATSEEERSVGWVTLADPDDFDLASEKLFFNAMDGEELRLAMRVDSIKPPAGEVRRRAAQEVAAREAQEGRELSRREKRQVKEEVVRTLRRELPPRTRTVDVVWDLDEQRLRLFSSVKSANELFLDLFAKTFAMKLEAEGPPLWCKRQKVKLDPTVELMSGFAGLRPLTVAEVE
jgi:DNA recombination-dependent growth factor C